MERTSRTGKLAPFVPTLQPGVLARLMRLALAAVSLHTFGELAGDVWTGGGLALDRPVMEFLHRRASPWLTVTLRLVTGSASGLVAVGVALGLALWWWQRAGRRLEAVVLLATLGGSAVLGQALKLLFSRPRPQSFPWLTVTGGWSFPSGHTLNAVVLGGLLAWLMGQQLDGWRRAVRWAVAGLWVGLIGVSRVYLGVHYPSDVVASLAVGTLCLLTASCVYRVTAPRSVA
jgi:undecaprenyl-diphosphatase